MIKVKPGLRRTKRSSLLKTRLCWVCWRVLTVENKQLLEYFQRARDAGVTGHEMTLTAADMNFDDLVFQHHKYRAAMAEQPENYIFVRSIEQLREDLRNRFMSR